jgi:hypothetical protein
MASRNPDGYPRTHGDDGEPQRISRIGRPVGDLVDVCGPGSPCLDIRCPRTGLFAVQREDMPPTHYRADHVEDRLTLYRTQRRQITYTDTYTSGTAGLLAAERKEPIR